ncbi:unnamed protein product [Pedinophyceae sp. YPF-701]|nr:unnamed protein product [Pedinophyceae sp. YPF-701]
MFSAASTFSAAPVRGAGRPQRGASVRCAASKFAPGAKVKVTAPITVYHVPKNKDGIMIEGMVGEVADDVSEYKGKKLSATFPVKVKFTKDNGADAKPTTFMVHMIEDELTEA